MLIVGIILVVAGVCDLIVAAFMASRQATSTSGLGDADPQAAAPTLIRRIGYGTIAVGVILIVIGLVA